MERGFKKEWLANYKVVSEPTMVKVPVANKVGPVYNPEDHGLEGTPRYIVNLKATTPKGARAIVQLFQESGLDELPFDVINPHVLTGTIWVNDGVLSTNIPKQNQLVDITTDFVETEDGKALRVTNIDVEEIKVADSFDFNNYLSKEEKEEMADILQEGSVN